MSYRMRLFLSVLLCGAVYWYGLPYVLLGSRVPFNCDYYGLQGHRVLHESWDNCPVVKVWALKYPLFAMYDGDQPYPTAPNTSRPNQVWVNKPNW